MDDGGNLIPRGLAPVGPWVPHRGDSYGLDYLSQILQRRWRTILAVTLLVLAIAFGAAMSRPEIYQATASLMIQPPQRVMTPAAQAQSEDKLEDEAVDTQVALLQSRALAGRVVDNLGLVNNRAWNPNVTRRRSNFTPDQALREREAVISRVHDSMSVQRQDDTYIVTIRAEAGDPQEAAALANGYALGFLDAREEARAATLDRSLNWLTRRTEELQAELERKEQAVEAYRVEAGLLDTGGTSLTEQEASNAQVAVLAARADLAERQARLAEVQRLQRAGAGADITSGALNSETISTLRARETDVVQQEAELAERYGDAHPTLRRIREERESVRQAIAEEVGRIAAAAESEVHVARSRLAALQGGMNSARTQLRGDNHSVVRLNQLEREAEAARGVYSAFLERRHALATQGELLGPGAEIVSTAVEPAGPRSRNVLLILVFGLGAGALLGLLGALAREHFDPRIIASEDVERLGVRLLSTSPLLESRELNKLPLADANPCAYLCARPRSDFAESYRVLRTFVTNAMARVDAKTLAVTSALPGDGKTTTALCLARTLAWRRSKVLLIDCDRRRGALNDHLGIEPNRGLFEVLNGMASWKDVVGHDERSSLHVLPVARGIDLDAEEIEEFNVDRLRALLNELRACYDVLILDCPPILSMAEAREIVQEVDHTLLVARSGYTPAPAFSAARRQVEAAGGVILGAVLNGVERSARYKSYADPLYFPPARKSRKSRNSAYSA